MVSTWRNFKNIFSRPLFTIIFRPEKPKFHPNSILTGDSMVGFVIFCVISLFYFTCWPFRCHSIISLTLNAENVGLLKKTYKRRLNWAPVLFSKKASRQPRGFTALLQVQRSLGDRRSPPPFKKTISFLLKPNNFKKQCSLSSLLLT